MIVRLVALAAATAGFTLAAVASSPAATPATADEVRALAARAARDPAALVRLRSIDRVDGRPVDLRAALDGARGAQLRARLRALSADPPGASPSAAEARRAARAVLAQRRFRPNAPPRLLRGAFRRIGELAQRALAALVEVVPGGVRGLTIALAVAILVAGLLLGRMLTRRRLAAAGNVARERRPRGEGGDPARLEAEADQAEAAGELGRAVRLRFRAGLLRLDRAGAIALRPSLTSGEAARRLSWPEFDRLAVLFDGVAYGARQPGRRELRAFQEDWGRVLARAGRREESR